MGTKVELEQEVEELRAVVVGLNEQKIRWGEETDSKKDECTALVQKAEQDAAKAIEEETEKLRTMVDEGLVSIQKHEQRANDLETELTAADNRFRNLNTALGKSQEMDTIVACTEASAELKDFRLQSEILKTFLTDRNLLSGRPVESAIQVIQAFIDHANESASEEEG